MNDDVDDMTEDEIDAEMKRLHKIQRDGRMTPTLARRLEQLRAGARSINAARKQLYWL